MIGSAPRHASKPNYELKYVFFALQRFLFIIAIQMERPVHAPKIRMNKVLPYRRVNRVGLGNSHGRMQEKLKKWQQKGQLIRSLLIYHITELLISRALREPGHKDWVMWDAVRKRRAAESWTELRISHPSWKCRVGVKALTWALTLTELLKYMTWSHFVHVMAWMTN